MRISGELMSQCLLSLKWVGKSQNKNKIIPDSCESRGFRLGSAVRSVIDAIGPIESVNSALMQFPLSVILFIDFD